MGILAPQILVPLRYGEREFLLSGSGSLELFVSQTQIHVDSDGSYYEVPSEAGKAEHSGKRLEAAQVSLNDCLACR